MRAHPLVALVIAWCVALTASVAHAQSLLVPMDDAQRNHLKAYGLAFEAIKTSQRAEWFLNYRGGSFLLPDVATLRRKAALDGVSVEPVTDGAVASIRAELAGGNMDAVVLERAPRIAIYRPVDQPPWDDAVTLALTYAGIDFESVWDDEVLQGDLSKYDWVHLHHEDFTGQFNKLYLAYRDAQDTKNAARALDGYLTANPNAPDHDHLSARLAALKEILKKAEDDAAKQQAEQEKAAQQAREAERARLEADQRARAAEQRAAIKPSRPWWPWLVVGGGVAVTVTGVVLGSLAASDAEDLESECVLDPSDGAGTNAPLMQGTQCAPSVDHEARRDSIQTQALVGDVMWIGGAAITATGLVLAFVLPDVYPDAEAAPVTAGCSTTECRATLTLKF